MGLPTGQMREETQQLLDEYNELYNWEYNDMCDFINSYGQTMFLTHYETYHRLCDDYSMELVDEFSFTFDVDTCLLYTSPSPRDRTRSRMPSSA